MDIEYEFSLSFVATTVPTHSIYFFITSDEDGLGNPPSLPVTSANTMARTHVFDSNSIGRHQINLYGFMKNNGGVGGGTYRLWSVNTGGTATTPVYSKNIYPAIVTDGNLMILRYRENLVPTS